MRRGTRRQPLNETEFGALVAQARATNAIRDASDRAGGFAAPGDGSVWMHLRTAMSAIEAGLCTGEPECVAEGYAMLEAIERAIRPPDFRD